MLEDILLSCNRYSVLFFACAFVFFFFSVGSNGGSKTLSYLANPGNVFSPLTPDKFGINPLVAPKHLLNANCFSFFFKV